MNEESPSAGDHHWREIVVRIYPSVGRIRSAVFLRRNKGTRLVWERRLGTTSRDTEDGALTDLGGLLRAVAAQLLEIAERSDRTF